MVASDSQIRITRSIPALRTTVGLVASLEKHKATVREDMKRRLTPEEHRAYRGITHTGEPWLMFEQLYNIDTTEELIKAEEFGVYHSPADCPGESFLFASGIGLAAATHPKRAAQLTAFSSEREKPNKTQQELDREYKETRLEVKDMQSILDEVAEDYVKWACRLD